MKFSIFCLSAVVLLLTSLTNAQLASYTCDPTVCVLPDCHCASLTPPVENPPQFLLLTFDDSIQDTLFQTANKLLQHRNPNGCPVRATWYAQVLYTDPSLAQQWYANGNEIGDHSVTHVSPFAGSRQELSGMLSYYTTYAGVPRGRINGVRFPFRNYTRQSILDLPSMGFTYDSSMSNSGSEPIWPYTLDNGIVSDCNSAISLCATDIKVPGLWELPMAENQGPEGIHLMDPFNDPVITAPITPEVAVSALTNSFNSRYTGNRAPFGLYLHPLWYGAAQTSIPEGSGKLAAANEFLTAAMSNPDVWMVTGQQVIEYMKNPVPASELGNQPYMKCPGPPTNICNGLTPSLAETCNLAEGTIHSCFGCPSSYPTLNNPNPTRVSETRCLVPDNCDGLYWDPIGCKCLCTTGDCSYSDPSLPSPTSTTNSSGDNASSNGPVKTSVSDKSGSIKYVGNMTYLTTVVVLIMILTR